MARITVRERFDRSYKVLDSGCWQWLGRLDKGGYGKFSDGVWKKAHRVSYEYHHGEIGAGLHVCHSCDNRWCVNPAHLWAGSAKDNMYDAIAKGRLIGAKLITKYHRGDEKPTAKLKTVDVIEIRKRASEGSTHSSIAAQYGVSRQAISRIVSGAGWAFVPM